MRCVNKYTILIADRNPYVRKFLKRELAKEGYQVILASSIREVFKFMFTKRPPDLFVIDPELFAYTKETLPFTSLQERIPASSIIVHGFRHFNDLPIEVPRGTVFVEKDGESIERLRQLVKRKLKETRV